MISVLIVTKTPSFAMSVKAVLDSARFQVIAKEDVAEAESLLSRDAVDVAVLDVELTDARAIRLIEEFRGAAPLCPVFVYTAAKQAEWEEDAFLAGVAHVLLKPVRGKILNMLIDRCVTEAPPEIPSREIARPVAEPSSGRASLNQMRTLEILRDFSGILTHSLNSEALLKQFLLLLREIIGVNRAIIFLRRPASLPPDAQGQDERWLRSACAIGLEPTFLSHFALSLRAGIGGYLHRQGRILRASSQEARASREISKEFQLLGAEVAIPILDRESLIGVAVFDERLTGEGYGNEELALIFHMLEEIGLAIRNSWLHDQLQSSHTMTTDILAQLASGCIVVGGNLSILHANAAARKFFIPDRAPGSHLDFADLPQDLGSKVFTVMKTGVAQEPFRFQFADAADLQYQVTISPFRTQNLVTENAALLLIEDVTQNERARRLEIETSNLRLIKSMAEHLAHEIGNSLVPLSTHEQLLGERYADPEFRSSLSEALGTSVKRISRLANQMVFLARDRTDFAGRIKVSELIVEAFQEAHTYHPGKMARLNFEKSSEPWVVAGDHRALRHAFSEVMLNALQANPKEPNVAVRVTEENGQNDGPAHLSIEVEDSGGGFSAEAAEKAPDPFFSTRNVGLGLGLTVTRKIIESHRGTIEISKNTRPGAGVVRISLPLFAQD